MPPTEPVAGTIDIVGPWAYRAQRLTSTLRGSFHRYGYEPVEPPVLERAGPFLDRSGEDIRNRMYIFADPSGRELCLRPELTIPTVRLYNDKFRGEHQILRAYYIGPVFRYDKPREGRYRQFTQVGAEFIGEQDEVLADAETLSLAEQALRSCGLQELDVVVSDIELFTAFLDDASLSPQWDRRLRALASDPVALSALLSRSSEIEHQEGSEREGFPFALEAVPEGQRAEVLTALLRTRSSEGGFGSRSIDDIVRRLLEKAATHGRAQLPGEVATQLRTMLAIDGPLKEGLDRLGALAESWDSPSLQRVLAGWARRVALFDALGMTVDDIRLNLHLRRGIAYYSGFIFEIHLGEKGAALSQLCAGGRYNELVARLGGRQGTPAVGFALGLERVLLGLEQLGSEEFTPTVDAFVVGGGEVSDADLVRTAASLRADGIAVLLLNGRRVRYALRLAVKQRVRFVAVVGEEEADAGTIVLRDLDAHQQSTLTVEEAARVIHQGALAQ